MNALRDSKYRQVLTFEALKGKITALQQDLRNDEDMDLEEESKTIHFLRKNLLDLYAALSDFLASRSPFDGYG